MNNPGVKILYAGMIATPLTGSVVSPITGLDGMTAVSLEFNFQYGSGGSACTAIVATSLDGGTTRRQIARVDFTTASSVKVLNLSGLLSKAVTIYADLASEGVTDGILGDQLQVILTSTGTYANTNLSVRASVR
jgi:hypothetical protein